MLITFGGIVHKMFGLTVKYDINTANFIPKIVVTMFKPIPFPNCAVGKNPEDDCLLNNDNFEDGSPNNCVP